MKQTVSYFNGPWETQTTATFTAIGVGTKITDSLSTIASQTIADTYIQLITPNDATLSTNMVSYVDESLFSKTEIKIPGSSTLVNDLGEIQTSLSPSLNLPNAAIEVDTKPDGSQSYIYSLLDETDLTKAPLSISNFASTIPGTTISVSNQGIITATANVRMPNREIQTISVTTYANGESVASLNKDQNGDITTNSTLASSVVFESGNQINVSNKDGNHVIDVTTPLTTPIAF